MNKEKLDIYLKSIFEKYSGVKVYNDNAPSSAKYPYIVIDSSNVNAISHPRSDVMITADIWEKKSSYKEVNKLADLLQNGLDRKSHSDDNITGSFYLNVRNNVVDIDKTLKRCSISFLATLYFLKKEK